MFLNAQFTLPEILSLLGLVQSVYVLVYMVLRSGSFVNAVIPSLYFLFLGMAFFLDAAADKWREGFDHYEAYQWLFWFSGIPLGALLIFQIANVTKPPRPKYFLLLLLIPITFLPGYFMDEQNILYVSGLVVGSFSLLAIWLRRDLLDGLHGNPRFGEERFWLIIVLIGLSTAFLGFTFAYISEGINAQEWTLVRTLIGIAFVYIAATSLFRIYPQVLKKEGAETQPAQASTADRDILDRLAILFERDKIYQDAAFGRAELARELNVGEASLSRIVNTHYGKTIPQLLNEHRVRDAQRLLKETDAAVQNVFEESGFNSITTFNRVFKDLAGESPTEYRARWRT